MKVLLDEMLPIDAGFEVILTLDRGIPHQQNLAQEPIGFVLIPDNDLDAIRRYGDEVRAAVAACAPGTVVRVGPQID